MAIIAESSIYAPCFLVGKRTDERREGEWRRIIIFLMKALCDTNGPSLEEVSKDRLASK